MRSADVFITVLMSLLLLLTWRGFLSCPVLHNFCSSTNFCVVLIRKIFCGSNGILRIITGSSQATKQTKQIISMLLGVRLLRQNTLDKTVQIMVSVLRHFW